MTDPKRLFESSSSRLATELLVAGRMEAPSPELVARFVQSAALGVAGAVATQHVTVSLITELTGSNGAAAGSAAAGSAAAGSAASGAAATSAAGAAATSAAATSAAATSAAATSAAAGAAGLAKGGLLGAALAKWVGVGVVGLAAVTGAPPLLHYMERTTPPASVPSTASAPGGSASRAPAGVAASSASSSARSSARSSATSAAAPTPASPAPVANQPRHVSKRPLASERVNTAAPARSNAHAPREASTLGAELASVDRARAAFSQGDARQALRELAAYEQSYPRRQLALEVSVLRMEAYASLGDMARARELAARVLGAPVSASHAARAREILNTGSP